MKINGPRNVSGPSSAKKGAGAGKPAGFAPDAGMSVRASSASALSGASAISSVDALLALQGSGDFNEARKKATDRAFSLLDVLDDLKIALLEGRLERQTLVRLMETLKSQRDQTGDPGLEAALDEVELRAAVELAKHKV
ncbi:MAG: flagellar assembly protein FliX [Alphaproteobacteria bacterium]|nr:flagellar assembly protein FliX [Alphaproteobacteria bacterium]